MTTTVQGASVILFDPARVQQTLNSITHHQNQYIDCINQLVGALETVSQAAQDAGNRTLLAQGRATVNRASDLVCDEIGDFCRGLVTISQNWKRENSTAAQIVTYVGTSRASIRVPNFHPASDTTSQISPAQLHAATQRIAAMQEKMRDLLNQISGQVKDTREFFVGQSGEWFRQRWQSQAVLSGVKNHTQLTELTDNLRTYQTDLEYRDSGSKKAATPELIRWNKPVTHRALDALADHSQNLRRLIGQLNSSPGGAGMLQATGAAGMFGAAMAALESGSRNMAGFSDVQSKYLERLNASYRSFAGNFHAVTELQPNTPAKYGLIKVDNRRALSPNIASIQNDTAPAPSRTPLKFRNSRATRRPNQLKREWDGQAVRREVLANLPIFSPAIRPEQVLQQNNVGDCYFLAVLASLANSDSGRELLRDSIRSNDDGTYTVRFYKTGKTGRKSVFVTVDGTTDIKGQTINQKGGWVSIYEKAYAQFMGGVSKIAKGGNPNVVLEHLTGQPTFWTDLQGSRGVTLPQLEKMLANGQPVLAMTPSGNSGSSFVTVANPDYDPQQVNSSPTQMLALGHQYSVTGVDKSRGVVQLYNPWGQTLSLRLADFNHSFLGLTTGALDRSAAHYVAPGSNLVDTLRADLPKAADFLSGVSSFVSSIGSRVSSTFSSAASNASSFVSNASSRIGSTISNTTSRIGSTVSNVYNGARNSVTSTFNNARDSIGSTYNSISNRVGSTYNSISNRVGSTYNSITNRIGSTYNSITNRIGSTYNSISNNIGNTYNSITNRIGSTYNSITNRVGSTYNSITNRIGSTYNSITNRIGSTYNSISNGIGSTFNSITNRIGSTVRDTYNTLTRFGSTAYDSVLRFGNNSLNTLGQYGRNAFTVANQYGQGAYDAIRRYGSNAVTYIQRYGRDAVNLYNQGINVTRDNFNKIGSGINTTITGIRNSTTNLLNNTTNGIRNGINTGINKFNTGLNSFKNGFNNFTTGIRNNFVNSTNYVYSNYVAPVVKNSQSYFQQQFRNFQTTASQWKQFWSKTWSGFRSDFKATFNSLGVKWGSISKDVKRTFQRFGNNWTKLNSKLNRIYTRAAIRNGQQRQSIALPNWNAVRFGNIFKSPIFSQANKYFQDARDNFGNWATDVGRQTKATLGSTWNTVKGWGTTAKNWINNSNILGNAANFFNWVALGTAAGGAATALTGVGAVATPFLWAASAITGAIGGGLGILDRAFDGTLGFDWQTALDVLSVVGGVGGKVVGYLGDAAKAARESIPFLKGAEAARNLRVAVRLERAAQIATVLTNSTQAVGPAVSLVNYGQQLYTIQTDPTLTPKQRETRTRSLIQSFLTDAALMTLIGAGAAKSGHLSKPGTQPGESPINSGNDIPNNNPSRPNIKPGNGEPINVRPGHNKPGQGEPINARPGPGNNGNSNVNRPGNGGNGGNNRPGGIQPVTNPGNGGKPDTVTFKFPDINLKPVIKAEGTRIRTILEIPDNLGGRFNSSLRGFLNRLNTGTKGKNDIGTVKVDATTGYSGKLGINYRRSSNNYEETHIISQGDALNPTVKLKIEAARGLNADVSGNGGVGGSNKGPSFNVGAGGSVGFAKQVKVSLVREFPETRLASNRDVVVKKTVTTTTTKGGNIKVSGDVSASGPSVSIGGSLGTGKELKAKFDIYSDPVNPTTYVPGSTPIDPGVTVGKRQVLFSVEVSGESSILAFEAKLKNWVPTITKLPLLPSGKVNVTALDAAGLFKVFGPRANITIKNPDGTTTVVTKHNQKPNQKPAGGAKADGPEITLTIQPDGTYATDSMSNLPYGGTTTTTTTPTTPTTPAPDLSNMPYTNPTTTGNFLTTPQPTIASNLTPYSMARPSGIEATQSVINQTNVRNRATRMENGTFDWANDNIQVYRYKGVDFVMSDHETFLAWQLVKARAKARGETFQPVNNPITRLNDSSVIRRNGQEYSPSEWIKQNKVDWLNVKWNNPTP